jgi:hypothetical protein
VDLPTSAAPTHRYIGASPACWELFSNLLNAGYPPLALAPLNALLSDAYAAQHPGSPSEQAINSVAVHLLVLYGVFVRGISPNNALWVRQRALRQQRRLKHGRFQWLPPPSFAGSLTVSDIVHTPTPEQRAIITQQYVEQVWLIWSPSALDRLATWYDAFVLSNESSFM